ncbi:SIR2 family protein [Stenotrophomonas sp. 22385]|uniref:SIR2 family protein n=1 Tax=Stenotrophomonas sp. 22385 TaxID=3453915 RepID=UPI003F827094
MTKEESSWYISTKEYSSLFERRFDLPRQRRMFIEAEVADKSPSIGYAYLVRLIENGYFNTVFTTNFDDLINEAFFRFSDMRPIVCAHDSSVGSVSVTSKRPKIIKLHGDYLFDDIKSTVRETESLEENTKRKFIEFSREHGLIVAGYSGADRSIMDVLSHLLRSEEYFRHGIYWCLRKGDEPSEELLKLLWRDRVYFVIVDGFDELMAQLHGDAIGDSLPVETNLISDKPRKIISAFCESKELALSSSSIIVRDIERLKRAFDREKLLDAIRSASDRESQAAVKPASRMTDSEVGCLISVKQFISSGDYESARKRLLVAVRDASSWQAKEEFLALSAKNEESSGDRAAACHFLDELMKSDPKEESWPIWKSSMLRTESERLAMIDLALQIDPFSSDAWNEKAKLLIDRLDSGFDRASDIHESIKTCLSTAVRLDPSVDADAWTTYRHYLVKAVKEGGQGKEELDRLVSAGLEQSPRAIKVLAALMDSISARDAKPARADVDAFIDRVKAAREAANRHSVLAYELLLLDAYDKFDRHNELAEKIGDLSQNAVYMKSRNFLYRRAKHNLKRNSDLVSAVDDMNVAVSMNGDAVHVLWLADVLKYSGDLSALEKLAESKSTVLTPIERLEVQGKICEARKDFKAYLDVVRAINSFKPYETIVGVVEESHALLLCGNHSMAEVMCKAALEKISYSTASPALIINYELSRKRCGSKPNGGRLGKLVEASDDAKAVACALYLLDDIEAARGKFAKLLEEDGELIYVISEWAIFQDSRGRDFLKSCVPDIQREVMNRNAA